MWVAPEQQPRQSGTSGGYRAPGAPLTTGADVISLDGTVDMADARARLGMDQAVQGNMDPVSLFGSKAHITERVLDTIKKAGNTKHVMNLGHGVMQGTPEENVAHFFQTVKDYRY